jgi:hypothetical protein
MDFKLSQYAALSKKPKLSINKINENLSLNLRNSAASNSTAVLIVNYAANGRVIRLVQRT